MSLPTEVAGNCETKGRDSRHRQQPVQELKRQSLWNKTITIDPSLLVAVRTFQKKLRGHVLIPFLNPYPSSTPPTNNFTQSSLVLPSLAETLVPSVPHVVEHRPQGPYQTQYNIAVYLLQRLMSVWGSQNKIEEYTALDFRVLCPPEQSFVAQTTCQISESRVLDCLGLGTREDEVRKRVIRCGSSDQLDSFLDELDEKTLYVVVAEAGHLTSRVGCLERWDKATLSDNERLLYRYSNVIMLYVSSHPYALQTNRSLVLYTNEIHWPLPPPPGKEGREQVTFCFSSDYRSSRWDFGVVFREDPMFEVDFQTVCGQSG